MHRRALFVLLPTVMLALVGLPRVASAARVPFTGLWPLPPPHAVLRPFAPPAHDWLPGNRGVDLAAHAGEVVSAAGPGTVAFVGTVAGVGVVTVRHAGGLETTYEPVRALAPRGATVAAGATLGVVVAHGSHCAPATCLHWGLRRGDSYLNPLSLVDHDAVRLLPMLSVAGGSWLVPAAGGASVGSSVVVAGWAVVISRRRRRRLPPGVASLTAARAERAGQVGETHAG